MTTQSPAIPGAAHLRSPTWFLWWLIVSQRGRILTGAALGSLWMVGLAVPPYLLSRAIDDGLRTKDTAALVAWAAAILAMGAVNAALAIARHRTMTKIRMDASFRITRATVHQATRLGAALAPRVTTGEVVAIGMADVQTIAQSLTVTGPGIGAVMAYTLVAVLLFAISPLLAVVVLAGVPLTALTVGPLLRRIQRTGAGYREQQSALTARLVDVITGLRVLNGLGGKAAYAQRFHSESRLLRATGYRVGAATSWVGALAGGLPALFLAAVTWVAARMVVQNSITVGDLVAVYGYVAMLVIPVSYLIEGGTDLARARVAAARVTRFLGLEGRRDAPAVRPVAPTGSAALHDPASGLEVRRGSFTVLASDSPEDAVAIIERIGGFADTDATWDGIPVADIRDRILVADNDGDIFAGTVRDVVAGRRDADDAAVRAAIHAAVADDIVEALPDGLGSRIASQGRNLSGGQRQRLRLARAVCAMPDVLLAVEPTSAVDAHTEATMIARLREERRGHTTLIAATSPLVLAQADTVFHVEDGKVVSHGTHADLLRSDPGYRALASREDSPEADA